MIKSLSLKIKSIKVKILNIKKLKTKFKDLTLSIYISDNN